LKKTDQTRYLVTSRHPPWRRRDCWNQLYLGLPRQGMVVEAA